MLHILNTAKSGGRMRVALCGLMSPPDRGGRREKCPQCNRIEKRAGVRR